MQKGRLAALFTLLMATVYLLAIPPAGYTEMSFFKCRLFFILAGGALALSALVWLELRLVGGGKRPAGRPTAAELLAICYLLCTAASALASPYPGVFWGCAQGDGLGAIGLYVLLFLWLGRRGDAGRWPLAAFGGAVTLLCLLGLIQLTGQNPLGLYPAGMDYYDAWVLYNGQFWATLGNTNFCAALLALGAGCFVGALIRRQERRELLYLIPLCLSTACLFALGVDAGPVALGGGLLLGLPFAVTDAAQLRRALGVYGWVGLSGALGAAVKFYDGGASFTPGAAAGALALAGALLLVAWAVTGRWSGPGRLTEKALRRALWALVLLCLLGGQAALYLYDGWGGFLGQAHALLHGRWEDSFGSGRLGIWRQSWALVGERPLLGGGPDTLARRGLEGFSRYNAATGTTVYTTVTAAHNEYLNILVNQGGLALGCYLAMLGCLLAGWYRRGGERGAAVGGMGALCYLVGAFFGISTPITAPYLWLALAALNKTTKRKEDRT